MPERVAQAIARVTYETLPIRNLRYASPIPIPKAEIEPIEYGLEIDHVSLLRWGVVPEEHQDR